MQRICRENKTACIRRADWFWVCRWADDALHWIYTCRLSHLWTLNVRSIETVNDYGCSWKAVPVLIETNNLNHLLEVTRSVYGSIFTRCWLAHIMAPRFLIPYFDGKTNAKERKSTCNYIWSGCTCLPWQEDSTHKFFIPTDLDITPTYVTYGDKLCSNICRLCQSNLEDF